MDARDRHLVLDAAHCPACGEAFVTVKHQPQASLGYCLAHGFVEVKARRARPSESLHAYLFDDTDPDTDAD